MAEHYVAVLERLFLVRRLPAWRRNPANRLVTSPKVHLLDSGLAATLAGLSADHWAGSPAVTTWGICWRSTAAASMASGDGRGLVRLADRCGDDFESGVLLYAGWDTLPLRDRRMLAVPLSAVWER